MSITRLRTAAAAFLGASLATLAVTLPAGAHAGEAFGGLADGASHPFSGIDHLLAMVMVGVLVVVGPGRALGWRLPAAFLAGMAGGIVAGLADLRLGATELFVAGSLVVLGAGVAAARRFRGRWSLALVMVMGAAHGHAHGVEAPVTANSGRYVAGVLLASAVLHAAGAGAGGALRRAPATRVGIGTTVATAGLLLLVTGA
jgi:urease accessory protein